MKINIRATGLVLTTSMKVYVERRLGSLTRFIKGFDVEGQTEIWLTISRTTRHHRHGDVFSAVADLRLPKKILRAEGKSRDARAAVDEIKDKLHMEIKKYKTRLLEKRRRRASRKQI